MEEKRGSDRYFSTIFQDWKISYRFTKTAHPINASTERLRYSSIKDFFRNSQSKGFLSFSSVPVRGSALWSFCLFKKDDVTKCAKIKNILYFFKRTNKHKTGNCYRERPWGVWYLLIAYRTSCCQPSVEQSQRSLEPNITNHINCLRYQFEENMNIVIFKAPPVYAVK